MIRLGIVAVLLTCGGTAGANVPALPCTSNLAMVSSLKAAVDNGDLTLAAKFLSDDVKYGTGSFVGKEAVISAFGTSRFMGEPSELVFATSNRLYFQRSTEGISEQLVSFECEGHDFDTRVVAVNMHRRNEWIEAFSRHQTPASVEQGEQ